MCASCVGRAAVFSWVVLFLVMTAACAVGFPGSNPACAAVLTWDADPGTEGAQDGSGDWNTSNTNWRGSSGNTTWSNSPADTAVFGAGGSGSFTVTLGVPITTAGMTFNAGNATYTITGSTLTITGTVVVNQTATIGSTVAAGGFYKTGSGTLIFTGANNQITNYMDVQAGVLSLRANNAFGTGYPHVYPGAAVEVQGGISLSGPVYLRGTGVGGTGSLRSVSGANTWSGPVYLHVSTPDVAVGVDAGSTLSLSGGVHPHSGSVGSLTKVGAGTLILGANGTYTGPTYVNVGTVSVRHASGLGTAAAGTTVASGAALELQGGINVAAEALTLNGSGIGGAGALRNVSGDNTWGGTVALGGATVGVDAGTLTLAGAISGSGTWTKVGSGTLILSAANSNSGWTDVQAGVLNLRNSGALGTSSGHVFAGAALQVQGDINPSQTLYIEGSGISGTGSLRSTGGSNTWSGPVYLIWTPTIGVDSGSTLTLSGGIQVGAGSNHGITKVGAGTLILSGAGVYTGPTNVNEGVLNVRHSDALGTAAGGTTVAAGATLQLQGGITVAAEPLTLASGAFLRNVSGDNTWGGPVSASTTTITVDSGSLTLAGVLSGGSDHKAGNGTLILTNANTLGGYLDVDAGAISLRHNNGLGSAYAHVHSGATLEVQGGLNVASTAYLNGPGVGGAGALRSVSGNNTWAGNVLLHTPNPNVSIGVDAGSTLTISGPIQPVGSLGTLTKVGGGTLIVSGAATYPGPTTVNGGTLLVNSAITSSSGVSVGAGATLGGSGRVPAVSGGGVVSPGASVGTLTAPSVDGSGGLDFAFEFVSANSPTCTVNDVLRLTDPANPFAGGPLTASNTIDVYFNVSSVTSMDRFRGGVFTDRASDFLGSIGGATVNFYVKGDGNGSHEFGGVKYYTMAEYNPALGLAMATVPEVANFGAGDVSGYVMIFVGLPEPSAWLLLALGAAGLVGWRLRNR